jgi:hypothetical protein
MDGFIDRHLSSIVEIDKISTSGIPLKPICRELTDLSDKRSIRIIYRISLVLGEVYRASDDSKAQGAVGLVCYNAMKSKLFESDGHNGLFVRKSIVSLRT